MQTMTLEMGLMFDEIVTFFLHFIGQQAIWDFVCNRNMASSMIREKTIPAKADCSLTPFMYKAVFLHIQTSGNTRFIPFNYSLAVCARNVLGRSTSDQTAS